MATVQTVTAQCRCGWYRESIESVKLAEVIADQHEAQNIRRPKQHSTTVLETR